MKKKIFFSSVLFLSIIANLLLLSKFLSQKDNVNSKESLPFLSKRIFIENQNDILINFIPLRSALKDYVAKQPEKIGVYFEYLPSGTSIGVNDTTEINLASLLKVPVVMAVYKKLETGEIKKDEKILIKKDDLDERFGDGWKLGENYEITVEEAILLSLKKSDNTASNVLLAKVGSRAIDDVFDSLDIPKNVEGSFHVISPKSYSSILRSLYLSSYLKNESSNEILEILTQTDFTDKIPAGVDNSIKVAHKIGVFNKEIEGKNIETYSDCGIIYVPQRPYILCIMIEGNENIAREHMKHLSKMVYGYIKVVESRN